MGTLIFCLVCFVISVILCIVVLNDQFRDRRINITANILLLLGFIFCSVGLVGAFTNYITEIIKGAIG